MLKPSPCPEQLPRLALHARLSLDNEMLSAHLSRRLAVEGLTTHLGRFEGL